MTSVQLNSSESQTAASALNGNLNQGQAPHKYDEAERVRQRLNDLRRHHASTTEIHNRTQPLIDEQIHEDTIKYLKSNQVNGTKTKSQKPRAPKRQKTSANNNTSANNSSTNIGSNGANNILSPGLNCPPTNHHMVQQQSPHTAQQVPPRPQIIMQTGMQPMHSMTNSYQQHVQQQQPMHIHSQMRPQNHVHQQTNHHQHNQYNGTYHQNNYQSSPIYPPQQQSQQLMQPASHSQNMRQVAHGSHYMSQQGYPQQNHHGYYQGQPTFVNNMSGSHQQQSHDNNHNFITLPNDLNLTLQEGLDCDVDSLINHEMSVEGQLDFNHDLLNKLDHHYHQPNLQ